MGKINQLNEWLTSVGVDFNKDTCFEIETHYRGSKNRGMLTVKARSPRGGLAHYLEFTDILNSFIPRVEHIFKPETTEFIYTRTGKDNILSIERGKDKFILTGGKIIKYGTDCY